jgi:aryl-alcohol dehydrogenase-like predicted oxidoreductase
VEAVRRGVNVIDTAPNFRCQRAERAVGRALQTLQEMGEIYRSEVLVASGGGFVPFDDLPAASPAHYLRQTSVGRGLCRDDELVAGCHCLSPGWLQASLTQSLDNLRLQTLDVFFVQCPETQLQLVDRPLVLERIRAAFAALEAACDAGQIRVYGIASWSGLRAQPQERDWLDLGTLVGLAESVAGLRHRFRAVQVPLNLAMPEAATRANQPLRRDGRQVPLLQAAAAERMVVLTSAPLHQGKLARQRLQHVPPLPWADAAADHLAAEAVQFARSHGGVASTLVGMRRPEHIDANVGLMRRGRASTDWLQQAAQPCHGARYGC